MTLALKTILIGIVILIKINIIIKVIREFLRKMA
jgi:hypothetical protein